MKVTRHAKRRWFTPQNHARIRWDAALKRFTVDCADAFKGYLKAVNSFNEMTNRILADITAQAIQPVIHRIISDSYQAQPPDTPDTAQPLPPA